MARRLRWLLLGLAVAGLVALAGVTLDLTVLRGRTPAIDAPRSIASLEKQRLGGVDQWVLLRGADRTKPVVLFLHGGPGMPAMYLAHAFQRRLERDFVVVQWDRRGAGKSFAAAARSPGLSVSQTLADTQELTERLRARFHRSRIYLVGHSWGSYLGLLAVRDHPECYAAFIGTGQMAGSRRQVRQLRREFLVRAAKATGDPRLAARLASPDLEVSEDNLFRFGGEIYASRSFWPLLKTGLEAPEYTLRDTLDVKRGAILVDREMRYDVEPKPLAGEVARVEVPVFFFLGRHDFNTPSRLAAAYLERLDAPLKGLVWFERSAHFPFFEEPARFAREMVRVQRRVARFWSERGSG